MQPTYVADFLLIDPLRLARTGSRGQSVILTISGLVKGNSDDLESLNAREGARLINRNLVRLTHRKTVRQAMLRASTNRGFNTICFYCSGCGRRYESDEECQKCGVTFSLESEMDTMLGRTPSIPPKVVAYASTTGHKFIHRPPQA